MNPNDSVMQHVAKVCNMANTLTDIGERVSETAIMAKILASLPAKYGALQTAWDSVDAPRQTLDNLLERLIKEENRLVAEDEAATALAAVTVKDKAKTISGINVPKKGQNKKRPDAECYYCHKKDHFERHCRKKKREEEYSSNKNGSSGAAFVATYVDNRRRIRRSDDQSGEIGQRTELTERHVTDLLNKDLAEVWLTDDGASKHITYRRDWFREFHSIDGVTISLGNNGTCSASGTGTIIIEKLINGKWCEGCVDDMLYVP